MKQNNDLFNRIQQLKNQNEKLSLENKKLKLKLEDCLNKINELELSKTVNLPVIPEENINPVLEEPKKEEPQEINLNEEILLGSQTIGDIIIKATGYINRLDESNYPNKKELVNLILGRTEIAKAEILNIVSSGVSLDSKKELMTTQFNEALEYFKSILEQ
ncbi:MAG: hypothetical protein IJP26_01595 [Clostridia bacterium]|nr:hypothetical protein [Clostridia bacterium]